MAVLRWLHQHRALPIAILSVVQSMYLYVDIGEFLAFFSSVIARKP